MYSRLGVVRFIDEETAEVRLAVHDVFYDVGDQIVGISKFPAEIAEDDEDDMVAALDFLRDCIEKDRVLDFDAHKHIDFGPDGIVEEYRAFEVLPEPNCPGSYTAC